MQRLAADPIQLVGVLAVALADDLSAAAETPEGFARSLGGDAIGNAPVKSFADLIKTNEPELARLRKQQAEAIAAAKAAATDDPKIEKAIAKVVAAAGPVAQTAIAKVSGSDVSGTFSAEAARGLAASTVQEKQLDEATAPTIFQGLRRKNDFNIARNGRANLSKVTVNYAQSDDPTKMKLSFEIGGGSATVKQSLESLRSYSSDNRKARGNGQNQADFQGAIYVSNNGVAGVDVVNEGHRGIELYLDITAVSGTSPTLDIKLQGKDETSGKYFDVPGAAFAQKTGTGQATLTIYPGIAESANVSVSDILAGMFRFVATIGGTDTPTFTFSLGANLKPSGNTGGGAVVFKKPFNPTPKQIKAARAETRKGWNERTHRLRAGEPAELIDAAYEFPAAAAKDLYGKIDLDE